MNSSVPLYVVYRLDCINYKIEYGPNYKPVDKKEKKTTSIDKGGFYIIFIQKKEFAIVLNFFDPAVFDLKKKQKYANYEEALEYIQNINCIIVLKNLKKEMAFLQENNSNIYENLSKKRMYCFDNYLKYNLCLPLFIQGKISKRYRIPTIDEYIHKKKIAINLSFESEWKRQRTFFKQIIGDMMLKISPFMGGFPSQVISTDLSPLLNYLICCGIETHHICCILVNHNSKRTFEKNKWNENIVSVVYEQFIKNPKPFDFYLLELPVENLPAGKSIMISPILSE